MMKLMIDIDGVLAKFEDRYVEVLNEVSGRSVKLGNWRPPVWDYEGLLGFTDEDIAKAWEEIKRPSNRFWYWLEPYKYVGKVVEQVNKLTAAAQAEVYFITTRPGDGAFTDSYNWLKMMGFRYPNVIISFDKGPLCKAIGITHAIDDRDKNCLSLKEWVPQAKVTMLAQPWNKDFLELEESKGFPSGIGVCPDPLVWLAEIEKGAYATV